MTDYLFLVLIRSSIVLVSTLILIALGRRSPVFRVAASRVALFAMVIVVALGTWSLPNRDPVVPVYFSQMVTPSPMKAVKPITKVAQVNPDKADRAGEPISTEATAPSIEIDWPTVVSGAWIVGSIAMLMHLLVGLWVLRSIRRSTHVNSEPGIIESAGRAASQLDRVAPSVLESDRVGTPFVAGILRPAIFIPTRWTETLEPETRDAVLQHEVAHIANNDLRWNILYRLLLVLLWPNPLLWLMKRPIETANEALCDRQVLLSGIPSKRYAHALLDLKSQTTVRSCPAFGIGAVSAKSSIRKRVETIMDAKGSLAVRLTRKVAWATRIGMLLIAASAITVFALPLAKQGNDIQVLKITEPYSTTVAVYDEKNLPVDIAKAWLVYTNPDKAWFDAVELPVVANRVEVDAKKFATIQYASVVVRTKSGQIAFDRLWPSQEVVNALVVTTSSTIRGTVILPSGKPAEGIRIVPVSLMGTFVRGIEPAFLVVPEPLRQLFGVAVRNDGTFELRGMPAKQDVRLDVDDKRYAHISPYSQPRTSRESMRQAFSIRLHPASTISGRVTQDGQPVQGVTVSAQSVHHQEPHDIGAGDETETNADGYYQLNQLMPAQYNVTLRLGSDLSSRLTAKGHEDVEVKSAQNLSPVDFTLIPGSVIEGYVVDEAGNPVSRVSVGVYGPAHPQSTSEVQSTLTDEKGWYRLHVPEGKQYLYLSDGRYDPSARNLTTKNGETKQADFIAKPRPQYYTSPAESTVETTSGPAVKEPDDNKPTPAKMSFGPGKPFYGPAKLPNGATVRLVYVQDDEKKKNRIWKPDGSYANLDVVADSQYETLTGRGRNSVFRAIRVEFKSNWDNPIRTSYRADSISGCAVYRRESGVKRSLFEKVQFEFPNTLKKTDLGVGVASGSYRVALKAKLGQGILNPRITQKDGSISNSHEKSVTLTVNIPKAFQNMDADVVIVTRSGKRVNTGSYGETNIDGKKIRRFTLSGALANEVGYIELKVRPYYWVTFKGIHLYPNR